MSVLGSRCDAVLERGVPVEEVPPGHWSEKASPIKMPFVPAEHPTNAGKKLADKIWVVAPQPMVVHHRHPPQGERRNILRQRRGIPALGEALGTAGLVELLDRVAHQPVV